MITVIPTINFCRSFVAAFLALSCLTLADCLGQDSKPKPNQLIINVRDYGAIGDGKADDTAAIEKAWAVVMDTKKPLSLHSKPDQRGYVTVNPALYFPCGVYRYTGKGLEAGKGPQCWQVKGDGFNSARIEIESNVYFITCDRVESTIIEGLSFVGGKGVFRSIYQGGMVGGKHIFRDCYFLNYTECAIGNNAIDSPYLTISDCIFKCLKGAEAIGIAWGGYVDDSQIERCAFERNAYHIKIGDRLSGNFQIGPRNSFISFGGTKTKADIWIVPNLEKNWGVNSGQGAIIADNKFGNENYDPAAPRILIAPESKDGNADRLSRKPDLSAQDDQNMWLTGVRIRDNLFNGGGVPQRGIVYSCIRNAGLIFDGNYFAGSSYPFLIEFAPAIKRLRDHTPGNTTFVTSQQLNNRNYASQNMNVSNLPGYAVPFDPDLSFAGRPEVPAVWQRDDDPGYLPLVSLPAMKMTMENAKATPVADAHGGTSAALFMFNDKPGAISTRIDPRFIREGKVGFIEVELKKAPQSSLNNVKVWLAHDYYKTNEHVCARNVELQDSWQRITLPFVVRNVDNSNFYLVIKPKNGDGNKAMICGNVRLYHAAAPHSGIRTGVKKLGDADATLVFGQDPTNTIIAGTITAPRKLQLTTMAAAVQPLAGATWKISRSADGNAAFDIDGITTLRKGEWCELIYDGTAWQCLTKGVTK